MKVIHLISGGDTGGAKTHIHTLLQGLNRHIQADMVCFTDGPFTQEARDLGIHTDVLSGSPPAVLKALRDKIRQGGYDLIHCHGSRGNLMGALLSGATGLPVVSTVHSDPRIDYMGRPLAALTFGTLNSWALRRIPNHIGVSRPMVDLLIDRGYDPQAVFDIPNGLDFSNPAAQLTRREYLDSLGLDWPDDSVIAGIAARLNPVKDMGTLLRGFALARREQPRLRLIIAGEGEEGPALRQLAQELEVADAVCFAGWVEDTDSFYHALDINTLTSLSEGFPYSLPEGARFALPTVATCVGGVPALIKHNVTGLLFQPRDHEALARCLAELAADPSLRRRLGDKLRGLMAAGKIGPDSRILFVNDGSRDGTWAVIQRLHREDGLFCGADLSRNRGHQNALLAGLMTAKDKADLVISMDADLQDDVDAADAMVDKYLDGVDIVYGVRSSRKKDSFFKRTTAEAFYRMMDLLGAETVFNHADYRLMSRRALDGLARFTEVNLFLRGIVPMIGYRTDTVEYERGERFAGESKYPLKKMLAFALEGVTSLSVRPLRMITGLGFLVFLASLAMIAYNVARWATGNTVAGWASLACSGWFIGGLILLSLGIIGEYLGKLYLESKGRPRFLIQELLEDGGEQPDAEQTP